jgi:hypothetical protein
LKQSRCSQDLVARSYGNREQFRELRCCARTIGTRRRKQICRQCRFVHVKGGPKAARTVPELTRSADIKLNARVSLRLLEAAISSDRRVVLTDRSPAIGHEFPTMQSGPAAFASPAATPKTTTVFPEPKLAIV